ncbi:MAG: ABC transporter permease [Acidithiobacillales bacterium SG8_45]|jgi:ABC-2 type transport system permease protein|nr:MAG: ABC transporter permease [Acidithiobacillales bacterium SG8_45]
MSPKRLLAVFIARNKEFLRDRSALAWNILFPVLIVGGFAIAFSGESMDVYKVALYQDNGNEQAAGQEFLKTDYIQFIETDDLARAITNVERHQVDMLLDRNTQHYWVNTTSPKGYMLERVLKGTIGNAFTRQEVTGGEIRYVDWLLPGVIGMNMMFSALFGVGYVLVRYRKNGVLKRLKATPLSAVEFLTAQVASRMLLIMSVVVVVYFGTDFFVDFAMFGSYFNLFLIFALGAISLVSLGLLIASRTASEEFAGGILNVVSWPMMFLSGVWFSLEGTATWVQKLALIFPLTHVTSAARAIMIDGASLAQLSGHITALLAMTVAFLLLGAISFKWE